MNTKECRLVRREIDETELNRRLSDQTLAHMRACAACREFRDERTRLRELVSSLKPVTAPADFEVRLRARIAAERDRAPRWSPFPQFVLTTPAMAAAVLIVMLAASIVWYTQRSRSQSSISASQPANRLNSSAEERPSGKSDNPYSTSAKVSSKGANPTDKEETTGNGLMRDTTRKPNQTLLARGRTPSRDVDVGPAVQIKQTMDPPGQVSLSAPDKPLVVSVQDDHGKRRKILLPPVSFGAQRLVDNRINVSTQNSRSW